jgi:hypothetical protein
LTDIWPRNRFFKFLSKKTPFGVEFVIVIYIYNMKLIVLFLFLGIGFRASSQGVLIGGGQPAQPAASAALEVRAQYQGFLPPRLSSAQRDSILNPVVGLTIFNTDLDCLEFFTQQLGWQAPCIKPPTVTTQAETGLTAFGFYANGTVVSDGGSVITQRGFCYGTASPPTLLDSVVYLSGGVGAMGPSPILNLQSNTTYYVRAFASNIMGTSYGLVDTVLTPPPTLVSFTVAGQSTWTAPSAFVKVLAIGGGGGGGGNDGPVGGGGGSGGAVTATLVLTPGQVYSIGVGGGGQGGNSSCAGPNGNGGAGGSNGGGNGGNAGTQPCSGGGGGGGGWSGLFSGNVFLLVAGGGAGGGGSNEGTANNVAAPGGGSQPNGNTGGTNGGTGANFSGDGGGGGGGGGGYWGGNGQTNLTNNGSASGGANFLANGITGNQWTGNAGGIDGNGGFGASSVVVPVAADFNYGNDAGAGGQGAPSSSGAPGATGRVIIAY